MIWLGIIFYPLLEEARRVNASGKGNYCAGFINWGYFFLAAGVIGLLRLPDLYNRIHAMENVMPWYLPAPAGDANLNSGSFQPRSSLMILESSDCKPRNDAFNYEKPMIRGTPMVSGTFVTDLYGNKKGFPQEEVSDK